MNASCSGPPAESVSCNCSIGSFKRNVYPASYLLIFCLGLAGNCACLCSFAISRCKGRSLDGVTLYVLNLLVSDLMLVCSLPLRATYYMLDSVWPFGDAACRIISFIFYVNMYGSIYFLAALSVVRCVAVVRPYTYRRLQGARSVWVVCLLIWLLVSLGSVPLLTAGTVKDAQGRQKCLELDTANLQTIRLTNHATMVLGFILPFTVITLCYIVVVRSLLKPSKPLGKQRPSYGKSCTLAMVVLASFAICFLPYHVVRTVFLQAELQAVTHGYGTSCSYVAGLRKAAVVTHCLASGNSCLDPLLFFCVAEKHCWKAIRNKSRMNEMQALKS